MRARVRWIAAGFALASTLGAAPVASAAFTPEQAGYIERAVGYWGRAVPAAQCPAGVDVIEDAARTAGIAGRAEVGGCRVWVGDRYDQSPPARRCSIVLHEYGHLLGYGHVDLGAADPDRSMLATDTMVPRACADLPGNPAVDAARAAARTAALREAWHEYAVAVARRQRRVERRWDCLASARAMIGRRWRVKARARCLRRLPLPPKPARPAGAIDGSS
jgi:hypothetical protein